MINTKTAKKTTECWDKFVSMLQIDGSFFHLAHLPRIRDEDDEEKQNDTIFAYMV